MQLELQQTRANLEVNELKRVMAQLQAATESTIHIMSEVEAHLAAVQSERKAVVVTAANTADQLHAARHTAHTSRIGPSLIFCVEGGMISVADSGSDR